MGDVIVSIPYVDWRNGRPRFNPGKATRRLGFKGEDLRHGKGLWFSLDEAAAWAKAKAQEIERRREDKTAGKRLPAIVKRAGPTVADLFAAWKDEAPKWREGVNKGRRREKPYSESTKTGYGYAIKILCAFDPEAAASDPLAISPQVAQGVYEELWSVKGLDMANLAVAVASSCWSWATRIGRYGVRSNPWLNIQRTTPLPRTAVHEDYEIKWLCDAAALPVEDYGGIARDEIGDAIYLGLFTGQRQGDRLALTDAGRDDQGRRKLRQSKTGVIIAIPETPQLAARLAAAMVRRQEIAKRTGKLDPHIIIDSKTGRPFKREWFWQLYNQVRRAATFGVVKIDGKLIVAEGLRGGNYEWVLQPCPARKYVAESDAVKSIADLRDADLRDTAVTWLARADCSPWEIASITGHSFASIHNILKHYLSLHPEMADAAIGKLVKFMDVKGMTL